MLLGPALLAALLGCSAASGQDHAFTANFTNTTPYVGRVLSNNSTINNNSTWLGNVVTNGFTINNTAGAIWTGDVQANTERVTNLAGGTWTGSVRNQGDFKNFGTWTGDVLFNSVKIENEVGATWNGDVYDNQDTFLNYGTWRGNLYGQASTGELNSYGDWYGDVIANNGTIYADGIWTGDIRSNSFRIITNLLDTSSTETRWIGNVITNDGTISNYLNATWDGDVRDNLGIVRNYARWNGDVSNRGSVDNRGGSTWTGDVVVNQGTVLNFAAAFWVGDVLDNAGTISNSGVWTGNLNNRGSVANIGIWTGNVLSTGLLFSARNQFIGNFDNRGAVQLTGDLAISGMLTNAGRLQLTQTAGPQTLSVGSVLLTSTSSYEIDVSSAGATDRIVATGLATLGGTVSVTASTGGGAYPSPTPTYTILTAGSVDGVFASVSTDLAFFSPRLTYDANNVYLAMQRNNVGFATIGLTANQRSVGATVEALGAGQPLFDAVLWLTSAEAQNAFDQLSGEGFESAKSAAILNAGGIRGVVLSRIDQAFDALGDNSDAASGYAGDVPGSGKPSDETDLWGQFYGASARLSGDGVSALEGQTGGLVIGLDGMLNDWRVGAMLQLGASNSGIAALNTQISSDDFGFGVYGGTEWGSTRLSLGGNLTLGATSSTRSVSFPGFSDSLAASYGVATTQGFAELSHEFDLGGVSVTPFAGLAQVFHATDGFTETGGPAALTRAPSVIDATFTTLGVGVAKSFLVGGSMLLSVEGSLGWRHAIAEPPSGSAALVGGTVFSVVGIPVARDAAIFTAGLSLDVDATTNLFVQYDGQASPGAQVHALKASLAKQF